MIYTPPSFSDHIAVSLLLDDACCTKNLTLNESDRATKKAQPQKSQKSIVSFFSAALAQTDNKKASAASTEKKKFGKTKSQKRTGIQTFFSAKATSEIHGNNNSSSFCQTKRLKPTTRIKKSSILNHFTQK
jgi:hypothetical protein